MANLKCSLGLHDWSNDCECCARCGKIRIGIHKWTRSCGKCQRCPKINHKWDSRHRCTVCGELDVDQLSDAVLLAKAQAMVRYAPLNLFSSRKIAELDNKRDQLIAKARSSDPVAFGTRPIPPIFQIQIDELDKSIFDEREKSNHLISTVMQQELEPIARNFNVSLDRLFQVADKAEVRALREELALAFAAAARDSRKQA